MFNRSAYENSRPDGIGVLEIVGGLDNSPGRLFVPLKKTDLRGEVAGPLAQLTLTQTYGYSREQCQSTLEAVYRFPLPGDAAVTGVRVRFGDVDIEAELKERKQAEQDYQQAKQEGRQAALATRESPDVFTLQIAGLQPDEEVLVITSYVQLARVEGEGWSLRIPLTTSPRYVRSDEINSRHAQGQPLALLRDPGHRFSLNLDLHSAGTVGSSTHSLAVTYTGDRTRVQLQDGEVLPDRDCVISWQPAREKNRTALNIMAYEAAGYVYFLALVAPPSARQPGQVERREMVLLVDHSGSMQGAKWEASDWAVKGFLSGLTKNDAFELGLFHNSTRWFSNKLNPASAEAVKRGIEFLEKHRDSGGTELGVALEQALQLGRAEGDRARHVLIVTDAEVSDEGRVLRLAEEESKRKDRRRISVLCIDAAPNSFLALELAERGGGVARFLTSSPEEEDITTALDEVLADWAEPVLTGLRLEINRSDAHASGRETLDGSETGWSAIDLGDLPAGRPIWVAGRVPRGESPNLEFRLAAGKRTIASSSVHTAGEDEGMPALKALYGARQVVGLEFLINSGRQGKDLRDGLERLGYDPRKALESKPKDRPTVYAENSQREASDLLHDLLVRESLHYGLASSETGFVAVRKEAGKLVEATAIVPNALPSGWSDQFLTRGRAVRACVVGGSMPAPPSPAAYMAAPSLDLSTLADMADVLCEESLSPPPPMSAMAPSQVAPGAVAPSSSAPSSGGGLLDRLKDRVAGARNSPKMAKSASLLASAAPAAESARSAKPTQAPLFSGVPSFSGTEAVLFDSSQASDRLPNEAVFSHLEVLFPGGAPDPASVPAGLVLLLFVDDLSSPRARVKLVDLVRQGGVRPLNVRRQRGQVVRLVLVDPSGSWSKGAPAMEVRLR